MKYALMLNDLQARRSTSFSLNISKLRESFGTILCVAGPNGSGKTTLIECLSGLLAPTSGSILVDGRTLNNNIRETKASIGFVPDDENWFIKELCAQEYFDLLTQVYKDAGINPKRTTYRARELAKALRFTAFDQKLEQLSHGNKKKVQIIAALMHMPKVVILDEMRNGLDPLAITAAEEIIKEEASRGACIIAATHDLWWAERIADETLLLLDGDIAVHDKTINLLDRYGSLEKLFMDVARKETDHAAV